MSKSEDRTDYYLRYTFVVLITGYHLMEQDMLKISFPGFLEDFGIIDKSTRSKSITEFSTLYSRQMILGIPATLLWGYLSDKFGCLKTSVFHIFVHAAISFLLGTLTDFNLFSWTYVLLSFFSNYTISLSTFMGWLPEDRKVSFIAKSQFYNGAMLQFAPIFAGYLIKISGKSIVSTYHTALAILLLTFNIGLIYAFRNYKEEVATTCKI